MKAVLPHTLLRYSSVGVLNTLLHWAVFFLVYHFLGTTQASANTVAFFVAVTFSYLVNASYTFGKTIAMVRYIAFLTVMGALSYLTGFLMDTLNGHPVATLLLFSLVSWGLGYLFSRYIVFR